MWRNKYRICVQLSQTFYNVGFGAGETIAFSYCGCLGSIVLSGCSVGTRRLCRGYSEDFRGYSDVTQKALGNKIDPALDTGNARG